MYSLSFLSVVPLIFYCSEIFARLDPLFFPIAFPSMSGNLTTMSLDPQPPSPLVIISFLSLSASASF